MKVSEFFIHSSIAVAIIIILKKLINDKAQALHKEIQEIYKETNKNNNIIISACLRKMIRDDMEVMLKEAQKIKLIDCKPIGLIGFQAE